MNRMVRVDQLDGAPTFHAEEVQPDDPMGWRWTGPECSGLIIANRENVITAIAELIGCRLRENDELRRIWRLHSDAIPSGFFLDAMGCTWIDHEYMDASRYLPLLVPEKP